MKIAQRKHLNRIIIVALLTALLTFNVGRVQSVKAVGTTIAAAAGATLCAVGIAYYSYLMLTGAQVRIPSTSQAIQDWLTETGRKVVQYPSGRAAYEELYPRMLRDPLASLIHDFLDSEVWTWTAEKIKLWANDFSSTDVAGALAAYTVATTEDLYPTNGFSYTITADFPDEIYTNWYRGTIEGFVQNVGQFYVDTANTVYYDYGFGRALIAHTDINQTVRNLRIIDNDQYKYVPQYLDGNIWRSYSSISWRTGYIKVGDYYYDVCLFSNGDIWRWQQNSRFTIYGSDQRGIVLTSPLFPQAVIHDQTTDTDLPVVPIPTDLVEQRPQWPILQDPDDEHLPVIPYYQTPWDPNWIDPVTGNQGGGNWGFGLDDLLDLLEQLAEGLIDIGILKELINDFARDSGDTYYISYDDSVTGDTYYQYNTITNITYGDDIVYQYNIDVSHVEEELPVDLNTIQKYTSNRYLDTIKQSASGIGSVIGEWFAFWHNVDAEIAHDLSSFLKYFVTL